MGLVQHQCHSRHLCCLPYDVSDVEQAYRSKVLIAQRQVFFRAYVWLLQTNGRLTHVGSIRCGIGWTRILLVECSSGEWIQRFSTQRRHTMRRIFSHSTVARVCSLGRGAGRSCASKWQPSGLQVVWRDCLRGANKHLSVR